MTPTEMIDGFTIELQRLGSKSIPHSEDIFYWINFAQKQWLKELAPIAEIPPSSASTTLEENFIVDSTISLGASSKLVENFYKQTGPLPSNLFRMLTISGINSNNESVSLRRYSVANHLRAAEDPFYSPISTRPGYLIKDGVIETYNDGTFTLQNVIITYLKFPQEVSETTSSDIEPEYHQEIINLAVNLFLARNQTNN